MGPLRSGRVGGRRVASGRGLLLPVGLAAVLLAGCSGGGGSSGGGGGGPSLSVADASLDEVDAGTIALTFTVTLSASDPDPITVDYATAAGSATAGADFTTTSGTLTFTGGALTQTLDVQIAGDLLDESDETFTVSLSGVTGNAALGDANATGTIRDDDPLPALAIADASTNEGDSGTTPLSFTVTLNPASGRSVTVPYATSNGNASAGSDYVATSGSLVFTAGQTTRTLAVSIRGDALVELDETFSATLASPTNATLADGTATGTILNDDTTGGAIGLDVRPANTTCVAPARPTRDASVDISTPFSPEPSLSSITKLLQAPGDASRWFVLEQGGRIRVFPVASPGNTTTWIDLSSAVDDRGEGGLLGMAFHPSWPATREVFVSYTTSGSPLVSRLSRLILDDVVSPSPPTEQILLTVNQPFDNHNGGDIAFGNDGFLYFGLGDGGSGGDPGNLAQNPTRLLGKMLRIGVVGVGFPSPAYTIPSGNPNAGNPRCGPGTNAQACPEIFASGLRNPWRFSIDAATGDVWVGDVGQGQHEEVDLVTLGGNYGWNCREGFASYPGTGDCSGAFIDPLVDYPHENGDASITGGFVYRGSAIPSLAGRYVFGDFSSGRIWALQPNGSGGYVADEIASSNDGISTFGLGLDGELYFASYFGNQIRKIVPPSGGGAVDTIPTDLVDTGCVDPLDPTQPASGLVPYAIQAPFWSDGAAKERHLAIPDATAIDVGALVGNAGGDFVFPNGTVILKNFRLGNQLIETRLLMRHPDGIWAGYTYEWNDAETAATRVVGGKARSVQGQTWIYPSEGACLQCHTATAGFALGPEIPQLNGSLLYPTTGRTANQLDTLAGVGLLSDPLPAPSASLPALVDPTDTNAPLEDRARAWLHTNCSQCHRPSGPTPSSMDLRFSTALSATNVCDEDPQAGSFGIANAKLIAPGDAARSVLIYRANRRDSSGMPPIGSNRVDTAGVALLTSWVESLTGCN
ncbi:MAG: PQQ-dependent sugar dehydrogenase [Deltaproteobacteria bacterium]|nr:PQQ-dependent sugar dehydrogenase [Deltaproteobacteria bacterium]